MSIFSNAKLISSNTDSATYLKTVGGERGSIEHIMSRSSLADFTVCPAKWISGFRGNGTEATKWGSLMDTLVLQPEKLENIFSIYPDNYPCEPTAKDPRTEKPWNNNATFCREWKEKQKGKECIKREKINPEGESDEEAKSITLAAGERAKLRLVSNPDIDGLLSMSEKQVMLMADYSDASTGLIVPFKAMIDLLPSNNSHFWACHLADFKTCTDASENAIKRAVFQHHYDWQAAIYLDMFNACGFSPRNQFTLVCQESSPPYQSQMWTIDSEWILSANDAALSALKNYCQCVASNSWPDYPATLKIGKTGIISREAWMV